MLFSISLTRAGNTWDGGAGTGNWNDGNNWNANGVPGTGALTFVGDIQTSTNNDRAAALSYGGINFTNDGSSGKTSAFTLAGASINLTGNITTTANVTGSSIADVISLDMPLTSGNRTIITNQQSNTVQHNLTVGVITQDASSRSLTKQGGGTLTFNGATSSTFTGGLSIIGGTVALDYTNMATPTNLLASTNALTIKGSNLLLKGKATGATAQTLGNVTIQQGGSNILIDPNGGTSTTLNLGTFDSTTSGVSMLLGKAQGAGSGTVTITTTTNKTATDIYRSRFVFADGTSTGYDWVTTSGAGPSYTLSAYSGYTALDTTAGTDTLNSRITASDALSGSRTTNTLKIEDPAASQSLDLAGNTLTLTGGGLLVTGTNAFQITGTAGNKLTAGNGAGSYDLLVHQYNSGGLDIAATIGNNGGNAVTLVKGGTGALTLSGSNTFTGGVYINSGELILANAGALNSTANSESAVTFTNGSTLTLSGNSVTVRGLTSTNTTDLNGSIIQNANAGAATLTVGNSGNAQSTFAGIIQDGAGGGTLALVKNGNERLTLSGNNTFSGGITLNAGTLIVSNDANLGDSSNTITVNGNATFSGGTATYARSFVLNGSTLSIGNETATITGDVSGTGGRAFGWKVHI